MSTLPPLQTSPLGEEAYYRFAEYIFGIHKDLKGFFDDYTDNFRLTRYICLRMSTLPPLQTSPLGEEAYYRFAEYIFGIYKDLKGFFDDYIIK